ncbi:MAG: general secretion pathway protein GspK [Deltaproteobacteria bacterium]|nr:general secretion pathway protein GspK [Deltaproteobacteria bacterium]
MTLFRHRANRIALHGRSIERNLSSAFLSLYRFVFVRSRAQRGVALLLVVTTIVMLTSATMEFAYGSKVELDLAGNARDRVRAEFLARSAIEFSRVIIHIQKTVIDRFKKQLPFPIQLWKIVPIDSDLAAAYFSSISRGQDREDQRGQGGQEIKEEDTEAGQLDSLSTGIKRFGDFKGRFFANVEDEDGKINVNMAQFKTQQKQFRELMLMLMAPAKYNFLFEHPDKDGNFTDREELIASIVDWVDPDDERSGPEGGHEDSRYSTLDDPYASKNAPFDTLQELHMVRGVNDEFMHIFGKRLTVWGKTINVLTADAPTIAALLRFGLPHDDPLQSPSADSKVLELAYEFVALRNQELLVNSLKDFVDFFKTEGLTLNQAKIARVAGVDSSVFKIKAVGEVGRARVRITAVIDASQVPGGRLVYWRLD